MRVQQDPYLFTASIENNIAYGDPWAGDDKILKRKSEQFHDHIISFP